MSATSKTALAVGSTAEATGDSRPTANKGEREP